MVCTVRIVYFNKLRSHAASLLALSAYPSTGLSLGRSNPSDRGRRTSRGHNSAAADRGNIPNICRVRSSLSDRLCTSLGDPSRGFVGTGGRPSDRYAIRRGPALVRGRSRPCRAHTSAAAPGAPVACNLCVRAPCRRRASIARAGSPPSAPPRKRRVWLCLRSLFRSSP